MPDVDGLEATRRILARRSSRDAHAPESAPNVVMLMTFDLDEYVDAALQATRAGPCSRTSRSNSS